MRLEIIAEPEYLRVLHGGPFSLDEARQFFRDILAELARTGLRSVLVDARGVTTPPTDAERYEYGAGVAAAVAAFNIRNKGEPRFAYVMVPPVRDPARFGETVAVNRGMTVKTFEDLDAALAWLQPRKAAVTRKP